MKRIITSASVVALGAAAAQLAKGQGLDRPEKPWSVSATVRGFYDDNYATVPNDQAEDSFGIELTPSAGINWGTDQTVLGLSYTYGMRYFEDRDPDEFDHSHQVNAKLSHAFNERYKLDLSDSFVVAQEPEVLDPDLINTPLRSEGDNIRNTFDATLDVAITDKLGTVLGYSNTFYNYDEEGVGSRSALLDRIEHLARINLRWQALPETVGILGYQFGVTDYTSNDDLTPFNFVPGTLIPITADQKDPEVRNNTTHYFYVGADQVFNEQLNASARVGAMYRDYDDDAAEGSAWSPYVDGNLTYIYREASYAQIGVRHSRTQTDVAFVGGPNPTLDAESTGLYTSLNHAFTGKLNGSILAQFQHSRFEGGARDGDSENLLYTGVNVSYDINEFLTTEVGYNFDRLDSDISGRTFSRNRVYVGLRATY